MKIGIGIDTGGTYTDAVAYDFESGEILGTAKSLTTRDDLSIGILGAIDALPEGLARGAELISLSTTLATNACVEDRGGRAKLIFFGGDKKVIDERGGRYGLPPSEDIYIQESFTKFSGAVEREPDWALFERNLASGFEHLDGVGILEMNAMRNGAVVEKKAKGLFEKHCAIPAVCGHELFSELNCLQRASSTLLNAGLFPVIDEFLTAVKKALAARGVSAALVIVRSDGSLMSEEFASLRPVETLLCGPAASAVGGTSLAENPNSIIVDMGGTTTDVALVNDGVPVTVTGGVAIGKWKTFVNGLYIKTIGLGGDSAIHYSGKRLYLEDYRVTPLCVAAKRYPSVIEHLKKLRPRKHTHFLYEHYLLAKDIGDSPKYTGEEKAFCAALAGGPLLITDAAAAVGKEIYTLDVKRLIKDGVVQVCGLTPTDIMHIRGDFDRYCSEASRLGALFAAHNLEISVDTLCDLVYGEVKRKLYRTIVKALLENKYARCMKSGVSKDIERFIDDSFDASSRDSLLSSLFSTEYSLVGLGAPIHIFLNDVAKTLNTRAIIPKHYEVANALGAVIGSVSAAHSVEILPSEDGGASGFTVFGSGGNKFFESLEAATACADAEAKEIAAFEAKKRGASGALTVTSSVDTHEAPARDCTIYLGTTVTARAIGAGAFT